MPILNPILQPILRPIVSSLTTKRGTSASLPAGALGVWYASNYTASPRPYIPNEITKATNTPSANLLAGPRRVFANTGVWQTSGTVTITDDAATAPDASNEASTATCSGNWSIKTASIVNLPAGTWTVACNVKRNTVSDQSFCFTGDNTATRSPVKTATSSWQRFSYTFTTASSLGINRVSLCSIDGVTAANLQICDLELYSGSSDLGPQTLAGHMYLGSSAYDATPTYAAGELNLSTGGYGMVQMGSSQTITAITVVALVSKVAAGSAYQASLSKMQTFAEMTATMEQSLLPQTYLKTSNQYNSATGLWTFLNKGYHGFAHRYNGTSRDLFFDDVKIFQASGSVASFTLRDMWVGTVNGTSLTTGHKVSAIAYFNRALSDSEIRTAYSFLATRATGLSVTPQARVFVAEGDSITAETTNRSYAYRFGDNASPSVLGGVYAVSGTTIADMVTRATALDAVLPVNRTGRKFILSVMIGRNDILSLGTATWLTNLQAYLSARRAAGWTVVLCATLPSTAGGFNAARNTTNATTSTWVGTYCDAYVSFSGSTMEGDADASDVGKYYDGTHPTAAGHILLEPYLRSAVNAL